MSANLQETAAKYANSTLAKLNAQAARTAGIVAMWFRAIPQQRSTDVIFQTYTLHNVEPCPMEIYVMYQDNQYDDAALTFSFQGIEYKPSLTLEIPVLIWNEGTKFDGSLPQEKDIVYIPMTNKLWQVKSMTPVCAMAGQVTSYKTMMETYRPEADRFVGGELKEAIDNNTTNIEKLFGSALEETIADLVDDKQTSQFSSTVKDKYKKLKEDKDSCVFTPGSERTKTIFEEVNIAGHLAARTHYVMNSGGLKAVEYLNIHDEIKAEDTRALSILFRTIPQSEKEYNVTRIAEIDRNRYDVRFQLDMDTTNLFDCEPALLKCGPIMIYGCLCLDDEYGAVFKASLKQIQQLEQTAEGWDNLDGFTIQRCEPINLMSADSEDGGFNVSVYGNRFISINVLGRDYPVKLKKNLEDAKWYGVIVNLSKETTVQVFYAGDELKEIFNRTIKLRDWGEDTITSYYIQKSNSNITNIRLYDIPLAEIDKQLEDLVSYNIQNASHAIVNDSADLYINNKYYGEQR